MYKAIFIDIDDTLLDFKLCSMQALEKAFKRLGEKFTAETFPCFQRIDEMLWAKQQKGELTIEQVLDQRFCLVAEELGLKTDGKALSEEFIYWLGFTTEKVDGCQKALTYLSRKYKLFAASNGIQELQLHRLKLAGLRRFFYDIYVSDEIGDEKPDRRFFEEILRRSRIEAGEALMIGDNFTTDIKGASAAGLDTCWFNPKGKTADDDFKPTFTVSGLDQLKTIL